ncbi:hypothetical protein [Streptomyces boninensis]|uniref:hypothetical protein n=1 Tax=Streptomyces boninensis TaxID=2039455 RepID=UPI003B218341
MSRDDEESTGGAGEEPERPAIPATPLAAYRAAAASLSETHPECGLPWELLAAIGMVESGHAWGGAVDPDGTMLEPVTGERRGAETVGPMQLSTAVWALWAAGGTPDAEPDPQNIHDAALTAGRFLCAPGRDLTRDADLHQAIRSFHNAPMYVRAVLSWMADYREGVREIPDRTEVGWSSIAADMVNHAWADVEEVTGGKPEGEESEPEAAAAAAPEAAAETETDAEGSDPAPAESSPAAEPSRPTSPRPSRATAGIVAIDAAPEPRRWLVRGAVGAALTAVALFSFPGPQIADLFEDKGPSTSERAGTPPRTQPSATPSAPPSAAQQKPKPADPTPEPSRTKNKASATPDDEKDADSNQHRTAEEDSTATNSGGSTPKPQPAPTKTVPGGKFYDWSIWLPRGR